jgi:WD40 repeat protein
MKEIRWLWFLLAVILLAVSCCQQDSGQEVIVYRIDGQYWTMNPDVTNARILISDTEVGNLEWSPNGRQVAFEKYSDGEFSIWSANSNGSELHLIIATEEETRLKTWLNEHTLLIGIRPGPFNPNRLGDPYSYVNYTLDLQDGAMQPYSNGVERSVPLPSGDQWITCTYGGFGLTLHSLDQDPQELFPGFFMTPWWSDFDISPSGQEVVLCLHHFADDQPQVPGVYHQEIGDTQEPSLLRSLTSHCAVQWSPDGKYIAVLENGETLCVFDARAKEVKYQFSIGPLAEPSFVWSPNSDGVLVTKLFGTPGQESIELARVDIETGAVIRLTENDVNESEVDWVTIR